MIVTHVTAIGWKSLKSHRCADFLMYLAMCLSSVTPFPPCEMKICPLPFMNFIECLKLTPGHHLAHVHVLFGGQCFKMTYKFRSDFFVCINKSRWHVLSLPPWTCPKCHIRPADLFSPCLAPSDIWIWDKLSFLTVYSKLRYCGYPLKTLTYKHIIN